MTKKPTRQQVTNLGAAYRRSAVLKEQVFQGVNADPAQCSPTGRGGSGQAELS